MNKLVTPLIFILLSVGTFFMYIDPQWQEVKTLQASNEEYNKAIEQSKKLLSLRDSLLQKYNGLKKADLDRLDKLLPDNIDNVRLIIDINSITSKYGASIKNVKLSTAASDGDKASSAAADASTNVTSTVSTVSSQPYNSMILSFSISASYETFLTILKDLERSLRLLDITSITFKANESEPYSYDVSIRTYWLK